VAPAPWTNAIVRPSGENAGLAYWSGTEVRRTGVRRLPATAAVHTAPPLSSSHVVYAIARPSGDHAGANSKAAPAVSRRGRPPGSSISQMWPTA